LRQLANRAEREKKSDQQRRGSDRKRWGRPVARKSNESEKLPCEDRITTLFDPGAKLEAEN
jgi:hypothetical protein